MPVLPEPMIIPDGTPNPEFWLNAQLLDLFAAAQNLSLTSTNTTIANNDKAGNLSAVYVVFTSNGVANTEDDVPHTLGRIPVGFIPVLQNKGAIAYASGTAWTSTTIYLKTNVASVAWTILVF